METQPIIQEEKPEKGQQNLQPEVQAKYEQKIEEQNDDDDDSSNESSSQDDKKPQNIDEVKIGDQTIFTIPPDMQFQQNNLVYRERKTRWGERQIQAGQNSIRRGVQPSRGTLLWELSASHHSVWPSVIINQAQFIQRGKAKEIKVILSNQLLGGIMRSKRLLLPPMLNYISPNISVDQVQYLLRLFRLDQLHAKMKDYTPEDEDVRSPSPQPIYDKDGKRINTRQVRKRDTLLRQRITLIEDCMKMRKTFVPPQDYKPMKKYKKIYLTQTAINDSKANYIGKIIGPQGSTQKLIEKRSGCKIAVRGRGANKHQKDIFQNYEPLHIIIVADNDEMLDKGVDQVQKILNGEEDQQIKALIEGHNRQLIGIFNDNYCENCQQEGHRTWACPFQNNSVKANVKCSICGQQSHPTADCPEKQAYLKKQQTDQINMLLESQYSQFKSDLNEKKPKGGTSFITDFNLKKQMLAIASGKMDQEKSGAAIGFPPEKKEEKKKPKFTALPQNQDQNLPKFDDD